MFVTDEPMPDGGQAMRAATEMMKSLEAIRMKYFPDEGADGIWTSSRTLAFIVGCMAAQEIMKRPDPDSRVALEVDYLEKLRAGFHVTALTTEALGGPDIRGQMLRLTPEDLEDADYLVNSLGRAERDDGGDDNAASGFGGDGVEGIEGVERDDDADFKDSSEEIERLAGILADSALGEAQALAASTQSSGVMLVLNHGNRSDLINIDLWKSVDVEAVNAMLRFQERLQAVVGKPGILRIEQEIGRRVNLSDVLLASMLHPIQIAAKNARNHEPDLTNLRDTLVKICDDLMTGITEIHRTEPHGNA